MPPSGLAAFARGVTNRARRGLYAGKKVLSGNNVSEEGGNRTRRVWRPNAQVKTLFSEILNTKVRLRVTTSALRTIDKMGGLDNYIMQTPDDKLDSDKASELKLAMLLKQMRRPWPAQPGAAAGAEEAAAAAGAAAADPKEP